MADVVTAFQNEVLKLFKIHPHFHLFMIKEYYYFNIFPVYTLQQLYL